MSWYLHYKILSRDKQVELNSPSKCRTSFQISEVSGALCIALAVKSLEIFYTMTRNVGDEEWDGFLMLIPFQSRHTSKYIFKRFARSNIEHFQRS